jgi:hypothetical protein
VTTVPPSAVPTAVPVEPPSAAPPPASLTTVRSTRLRVKGRRVAVSLRCTGTAACKGKLRLRTAAKVRFGKKKAKRVLTLTSMAKYSLQAGTRATVRLSLARRGRSYMAAHRKVRVALEVKPASGVPSKRKLTLRR